MDTLAQLAAGFAVALTPYNLLWRLVGVMLGTFVGVLPGIGPALTVALLLPVTYKLEPTALSSCSPGSTTARCTAARPPPSCSTRRASPPRSSPRSKATRWRERGRAAAALATAAIGSFVAGTIGTHRPHVRRAAHGGDRARVRPGGILRADRAGLRRPSRRCWAHRAAGLVSLFFGLGSAWSASTADRPGPLHLRRRRSCSTASTWSSSRSGCSRWGRRSGWRRGAARQAEVIAASAARSG